MNDSDLAASLQLAQGALLTAPAIVSQGSGKAYLSVAQSMAIAVQDATDGLRNTTTVATTAMGVALSQFLATKDPSYLQALAPAQDMIDASAKTLATVSSTASDTLKTFPSGTA